MMGSSCGSSWWIVVMVSLRPPGVSVGRAGKSIVFRWMRTTLGQLGSSTHITRLPCISGQSDSMERDGEILCCLLLPPSLVVFLLICLRAPEQISARLVTHMAAALGLDYAVLASSQPRGEVETFVSKKGHVTDWHFDFMENFTFQLKGTKVWKFKRSTIAHPIRGSTSHYRNVDTTEQQNKIHQLQDPQFDVEESFPQRADDPEVITVELRAGDVLYHPAGIWHRVECNDDSISINVSLMPMSWADVLVSALKQRL